MGLIGKLVGAPTAVATLGHAARELAEVFTPNATRAQDLMHQSGQAALAQHGAEFVHAPTNWFDRAINGLNRLPRPLLALGTLGLFVYAMAEPDGFGLRMRGLALVPEPLWWLLGAIVAFYFGARETHYRRVRHADVMDIGPPDRAAAPPLVSTPVADNPALAQWQHRGGER